MQRFSGDEPQSNGSAAYLRPSVRNTFFTNLLNRHTESPHSNTLDSHLKISIIHAKGVVISLYHKLSVSLFFVNWPSYLKIIHFGARKTIWWISSLGNSWKWTWKNINENTNFQKKRRINHFQMGLSVCPAVVFLQIGKICILTNLWNIHSLSHESFGASTEPFLVFFWQI